MNSRTYGLMAFLGLSLVLLLSSPGYAQLDQERLGFSPQAGSSNFRYAEPNELTIVVSVIGAVRTPGRYEVSLNVNLLDVIALAGGWTENADWSDVTLTRLVQGGTSGARKEIQYDFDDLTRIKDSELKLQQGDIIVVPTSSSVTFDDVLRYATTVAVIITMVIAIQNN